MVLPKQVQVRGARRGSVRRRTSSSVGALLSAVALSVSVVFSGAAAQASGPWELPDGVTRVNQVLYQVDDEGSVIRTGPVSPGRTFFYGFELSNNGDEPVTVTGFDANFSFLMHPSRQGDFPLDHCEQFITQRTFAERAHHQTYPQTIEPGETVELFDNTTYHYIHGPVSNECQQGAFLFGAPIFGTANDDDVVPEPISNPPTETVEGVPVMPTPPRTVETAANSSGLNPFLL